MHPSRAISASFLVAGLLVFAQAATTVPPVTLAPGLQLLGGAFLVVASVVGLFQYEQRQTVSEWGPLAYLLLFGAAMLALGSGAQLVLA